MQRIQARRRATNLAMNSTEGQRCRPAITRLRSPNAQRSMWRRSNLRRAAFRSAVVLGPERGQSCNRLHEVSQPFTRAVIRVYDEAGNVIQTHEHAGDFKEP